HGEGAGAVVGRTRRGDRRRVGGARRARRQGPDRRPLLTPLKGNAAVRAGRPPPRRGSAGFTKRIREDAGEAAQASGDHRAEMTDVAEGLTKPVAAPAPPAARQDVALTAAKAAAGAITVVVLAFGLWRVRSIVVLLLLALTFAAAIRPGVDWLRRHRVPQSLAIGVFFVSVLGTFFLFFWLAIPPALHQISQALAQPPPTSGAAGGSTRIRRDVLAWLDRQLHELPSGSQVLHPVAAYGHKATEAVVAVFFTLAASWYWVSERDKMIDLLALLAPEAKRDKARQTYLAIDQRLGSYTRLKVIMIFVLGFVLLLGFFPGGAELRAFPRRVCAPPPS